MSVGWDEMCLAQTQRFDIWLEGEHVEAASLNAFTAAIRILGYEVVDLGERIGVKRLETPVTYEPWNPIHAVRVSP